MDLCGQNFKIMRIIMLQIKANYAVIMRHYAKSMRYQVAGMLFKVIKITVVEVENLIISQTGP